MTRRAAVLVPIALSVVLAAGCASSGTAPRPRPFPGAPPAPDAAPVFDAALITTALALRGTPYANGGSAPTQGFDCSGFVQWVFAQHGARLPREVREQYGLGVKIDRDRLQPGDLVFFETVSRGASHVGIAIGGGEFVHAPSSRGVVRVERYTSEYWASRWVGGRRVVERTGSAAP